MSLMLLASSIAFAAPSKYSNAELSKAIRMYKAGNYTQCYSSLNNIVKKDPANALAYYYLAMTSAQIGHKEEAISNYQKAIVLAGPRSNLTEYAEVGKTCLETPDKCKLEMEVSEIKKIIKSKNSFSHDAQGEYEQLKIDDIRRRMNKSNDLSPQDFKKYKDFSSYNDEVPTNDEIVAAMRTLQKAGLGDMLGTTSELSLLTGNNYGQNQMLNSFDSSKLSPQLIQMMLTNNMSMGF